jgi:phage gpG-like protein
VAGVFVSLHPTGTDELGQLLKRIASNAAGLEPAFAEIGEYLIESTQERINAGIDVHGDPFEPLAAATIARKGHDEPLKDSLIFIDTLNYDATGSQLLFGTHLEYIAPQILGTEHIPQREAIGLDDDDTDVIIEILNDHLMDGVTS